MSKSSKQQKRLGALGQLVKSLFLFILGLVVGVVFEDWIYVPMIGRAIEQYCGVPGDHIGGRVFFEPSAADQEGDPGRRRSPNEVQSFVDGVSMQLKYSAVSLPSLKSMKQLAVALKGTLPCHILSGVRTGEEYEVWSWDGTAVRRDADTVIDTNALPPDVQVFVVVTDK